MCCGSAASKFVFAAQFAGERSKPCVLWVLLRLNLFLALRCCVCVCVIGSATSKFVFSSQVLPVLLVLLHLNLCLALRCFGFCYI